MNWLEVGQWLKDHACPERRRYKTCGCRSRTKHSYNPCQRLVDADKVCQALHDGTGSSEDIEEMAHFVKTRHCHFPMCQHKRCIRGEEISAWIEKQMELVQMRKVG